LLDNTGDASIRPNQIFAVSLPYSMLDDLQARAVVDVVERHLLTPLGLRSLAPKDPAYRGVYRGGVLERDSAYHQGSVWLWLMGPFLSAYARVYPGSERVAELVDGLRGHLREAGVGQMSEIADGDAPFTPRGCFAQAWSVAGVLRAVADGGWNKLTGFSDISRERGAAYADAGDGGGRAVYVAGVQ
jgi:glycogen debranching enzyme